MKRILAKLSVVLCLISTVAFADSHIENHHHAKDEPVVLRVNDLTIGKSHRPDELMSEIESLAKNKDIEIEIDEVGSTSRSKDYSLVLKGKLGKLAQFCKTLADSDDTDVAAIGSGLYSKIETKFERGSFSK